MVIDGCVMLTQRDNFLYHEMMTHPALFTHAAPRRVVVIGGGDCGTLREVLRHDIVQQAMQVEIDERVTRLSERYFPELCTANGDPRAELRFEDGIAWFAHAPAGSVDVVIVDSTDPVGPAEGLFSEPFYRDVHRVLAPGGLIVQQSESPLYHVDLLCSVHGALRRAGFADVKTLHYPQPVYPSGWWSATLACKDGPVRPMRLEAARKAAFPTRYYSVDMHQAAFVLPPYLADALAGVAG
jgi:spermidine synthase